MGKGLYDEGTLVVQAALSSGCKLVVCTRRGGYDYGFVEARCQLSLKKCMGALERG